VPVTPRCCCVPGAHLDAAFDALEHHALAAAVRAAQQALPLGSRSGRCKHGSNTVAGRLLPAKQSETALS